MSTLKHALAAGLVSFACMQFDSAYAQVGDPVRELESARQTRDRLKSDSAIKQPGGNPAFQDLTQKPNPWRKLKPGMTETEVTGVLGVPDRVESQAQTFRWYWEKGDMKGWVSFGGDSRRVIEWRNL